jgi:hypothetical protein
MPRSRQRKNGNEADEIQAVAIGTMTLAPETTIEELREALAESVKLQSHYATLLNVPWLWRAPRRRRDNG